MDVDLPSKISVLPMLNVRSLRHVAKRMEFWDVAQHVMGFTVDLRQYV